tara:strand:- start:228 stop:437 length:210 start_codon:yes stop_codon:yes gene_type:complete
MSEQEWIQSLEHRIDQLNKHIQTQDQELYRMQRQVEQVLQVVELQKLRLEQAVSQLPTDAPADEKPPHY